MKILFIYPEISSKSGGGVLTNTIRDTLLKITSDLVEYHFPLYMSSFQKLKNQLSLHTMGMTKHLEDDIINKIKQELPDIVIINSSRIGCLCKRIKCQFPEIKVITIFHNVELKFVFDGFKSNKNIFSLLTILATWYNERLAIKYSDDIVALNDRDAKTLQRVYCRPVNFIMPLCLNDRFDFSKVVEKKSDDPVMGAFIGSNFYANNRGIKWFCENVSNKINYTILIIGKGFENEAEYFSHFPNIKLIGTVNDIDSFYYNIDFVVSPIFDGSGMKTKTAEALMFGKTIFGTTEAFEGYEVPIDKIGKLCNSADEFISTINSYDRNLLGGFNKYSRSIFLQKYSDDILVEILNKIIKND